jgi:hypothetical protein
VSNCHAHARNDEGLGSGFRIGERNGWEQGWLYNYNSTVAGYRLTSVWRGKVQAGTPVQLHKKGEMMPLWHHPTHTFTTFSLHYGVSTHSLRSVPAAYATLRPARERQIGLFTSFMCPLSPTLSHAGARELRRATFGSISYILLASQSISHLKGLKPADIENDNRGNEQQRTAG